MLRHSEEELLARGPQKNEHLSLPQDNRQQVHRLDRFWLGAGNLHGSASHYGTMARAIIEIGACNASRWPDVSTAKADAALKRNTFARLEPANHAAMRTAIHSSGVKQV